MQLHRSSLCGLSMECDFTCTRACIRVQVPMWDKFLKASGRALRTGKAMAATIVEDCVEIPIHDSVEVKQF